MLLVGAALFVYQINRPLPTALSNLQLQSIVSSADGLLVDLDPIRATWHASGEESDIDVHVENLDTGRRTRSLPSRSVSDGVEFSPEDLALIVSERRFGRSNRIRVVAQAREATFYSQEFRLHVGLTVLAVVFENQVKIAAVVDNSLVQRYNFEARLVVPTRSNGFDYLTLGGEISSGQEDYDVGYTSQYHWPAARVAYLGPDDERLVRYEVIYD